MSKKFIVRQVLFAVETKPSDDPRFTTESTIPVAIGGRVFSGLTDHKCIRQQPWTACEGLQFGKFNQDEYNIGSLDEGCLCPDHPQK